MATHRSFAARSKSRWFGATWSALCVACVLVASCGKVTSRTYWPNGRPLFVSDGYDEKNERHGVWVYYTEDGQLMYTQTFDGVDYDRTGVYEHGRRVRLPNEQELAAAKAKADELMREFRR